MSAGEGMEGAALAAAREMVRVVAREVVLGAARETVAARNREIERQGGPRARMISLAQVRLQLGWIRTRETPWRGHAACLDLCIRAGWCLADGGDAGLTDRGLALLAALDAVAEAPVEATP